MEFRGAEQRYARFRRSQWIGRLGLCLLLWGGGREGHGIPLTLHYQVRIALSDTGQAPATGYFKFALVDGAGAVRWNNEGTTNSPPAAPVTMIPRNGVFNVSLGDTNVVNMASIPAAAFAADQLSIRVWFSEDNVTFDQLSPDRELGSVAFAVRAARADAADSIPEGVLTERHLPAGFVQQVNALTAQLAAMSNQLSGLSQTQELTPIASSLPNDTNLLFQGYAPFLTVPAASWEIGDVTGMPSARFGHSAIWSGSEILVWGGQISVGNYTATGARYHPETDSWEDLPRRGAPAGRAGHVAVWTGSQMVVWGGVGDEGFLRTGGRFDVSAQVWRETSRLDAPGERTGHSGVWTGKYLVVFGGQNASGHLNSTAVYEPEADRWQRLNFPNQPAPRVDAEAVWIRESDTSGRMMVWGGRGATGALNDGGQLIFENGEPVRWTTVSIDGAPGGRHDHSLVWTGEKVLVWGGERSNTPLGTGGCYDPFADTWELFTGDNSPSARSGQIGIWTGRELLIQGGETSGGVVDSGYAVNPGDRQWRELDDSVSALPRRDGAGVWAGDRVIIFGGRDAGGGSVAALRHLDPQPTVYLFRKQ